MARTPASTAQAWIELVSDDPAAVSALTVIRSHLPQGQRVRAVRRLRLLELRGTLPERADLADLLHRSTQFYNPHKERCTLRLEDGEPTPLRPGEQAVLVYDREGERRPAAERWWRHETGRRVEVREGTAWAVTFTDDAPGALEDLALVRGRRQGLLCNPHSQDYRIAVASIPVPWIDGTGRGRAPRRRTPKGA